MVSQKKYDKLKAMLIAQRKKNRSFINQDLNTKYDPKISEIISIINYTMWDNHQVVTDYNSNSYDSATFKRFSPLSDTTGYAEEIYQAYVQDIENGAPDMASWSQNKIIDWTIKVGGIIDEEDPKKDNRYPNLSKILDNINYDYWLES